MKAVVFYGVGDIRLADQPDPRIRERTDAIVRMTASAICGTDLHMVRGTLPGMKPGTILGHEGIGIVEELGSDVRHVRPGDRVVIPSTIACGSCSYCRAGYQAQCDHANPNGPRAGSAFFGGPAETGAFQGLQAEKALVPFANAGLIKLPDHVTDDQAILLSDIFPTGYFGAELAEIKPGNTVAVFGCGPVGQFAIVGARLFGAGRIFAVDNIDSRLAMAQAQGAEIINFGHEDPVDTLLRLTGGIGPDRAIDAVGVDAVAPSHGPARRALAAQSDQFDEERRQIAPQTHPVDDNWHPGDAPSLVLSWAVQSLAKAGTLAIIGVYPQTAHQFPIGAAMNKNLTVKMGNCHHRRYIPTLLASVANGTIQPEEILTQSGPLYAAIDAYKAFDTRQPGWMKVKLEPEAALAGESQRSG
jgi:threonine dehydrogenase-like Zn-dependent dehydrogenase